MVVPLSRFPSKRHLLSSRLQDDGTVPSQQQSEVPRQPAGVASRMLTRLLSWRSSTSSSNANTKTNKCASLTNMKLDTDRFEAESPVERKADATASSLPRVASNNINIPLKKCASEQFPPRARRVPSRRRHFSSGDNTEGTCRVANDCDQEAKHQSSDASSASTAWRKQQRQCANCGQIFFRSLPGVRLGDYCSLDCKTSHRYMKSVHVAVDAQLSSLVDTWVDDGSSSSASSSTSIDEEGDVVSEQGKCLV